MNLKQLLAIIVSLNWRSIVKNLVWTLSQSTNSVNAVSAFNKWLPKKHLSGFLEWFGVAISSQKQFPVFVNSTISDSRSGMLDLIFVKRSFQRCLNRQNPLWITEVSNLFPKTNQIALTDRSSAADRYGQKWRYYESSLALEFLGTSSGLPRADSTLRYNFQIQLSDSDVNQMISYN